MQVREDRHAEARSIAARCRSGEFRALLEDQFNPNEENHCPNCGSRTHWKRRPLPRAAMAILLSVLGRTILPPVGWVYFCGQCGTKYRHVWSPLTRAKMMTLLLVTACDLIPVLVLVLITRTRYWPLVVATAVVIAAGLSNWLARSDNDPDDTSAGQS